ncbi:MAG: HAMP domain-containing histidine kinase [Campylobacteraceae bacterium]|nr:HAMP domain-containing histidine kinase [Campylobacteraceae bacterium]
MSQNSLFVKVTLLFLTAIFFLSFIAYDVIKQNALRLETLTTKRYIQLASSIKKNIIEDDVEELEKELGTNSLELICFSDACDVNLTAMKLVGAVTRNFDTIEIYKDEEGHSFIRISVLGRQLVIKDNLLRQGFFERHGVLLLFTGAIISNVLLYLVVMNLFSPIRRLKARMEDFAAGDLSVRAKISSEGEIGELAAEFNAVADKMEALLKEKEELLADKEELLANISHELRTPIMKIKLALGFIDASKYKESIQKAVESMDSLTTMLLENEELSFGTLKIERINTNELYMKTVAAMADNAECKNISEQIFDVDVDVRYFTMALKNLLENAIKYSDDKTAIFEAKDGVISVLSKGDKLEKDISYYVGAFTKGDKARLSGGYGLGLSIVSKILRKHGLELDYSYDDAQGLNRFFIDFNKKNA